MKTETVAEFLARGGKVKKIDRQELEDHYQNEAKSHRKIRPMNDKGHARPTRENNNEA